LFRGLAAGQLAKATLEVSTMSQEMSDFESLCREWADLVAREQKAKVKRIWFYKNPFRWSKNKPITARVASIVYLQSAIKKFPRVPISVQQWIDNDSSLEQTIEADVSLASTSSYTTEITAGIKIGATVKGKAGIPVLAEGEVSVSTEIDFSYTGKWTTSNEKTFTLKQPVRIAPKTSMAAIVTASRAEVAVPFEADIVVEGYFFVEFNKKMRGGGTQWAFPIGNILNSSKKNYRKISWTEIRYLGQGETRADLAFDAKYQFKEYPLAKQPETSRVLKEMRARKSRFFLGKAKTK
jgi:hypothetical protein